MRKLWLLVWLLIAVSSEALTPPREGEIERYRQDGSLAQRQERVRQIGNDHAGVGVAERTLSRLQSLSAPIKEGTPQPLAPLPAWQGLPTKGTNLLPVLLVRFPDHTNVQSEAAISNLLSGVGNTANYPYESLRAYYARSSYGQLDLQGRVLGWYTAQHERSWYTNVYGEAEAAYAAIIQEAASSSIRKWRAKRRCSASRA